MPGQRRNQRDIRRSGALPTAEPYSPIAHRTRSRAPIRGREQQDQLPQGSRRRQNLDAQQRQRSRSPLGNNQPQQEDLPPRMNRHPVCQICRGAMVEGADVITIPCSHQFHGSCLSRWFLITPHCPSCQEFARESILYEWSLDDHMIIKAEAHGQFWARQIPISISYANGPPTLHGIPGQNSPLNHISNSTVAMWVRQPTARRAERGQSHDPRVRDRSRSPIDRNQAEQENVPTSPPNNQVEELPTCSICLEDLAEGEQTVRTNCSHLFHKRCIWQWVQESDTCPLCRQRVPWNVQNLFLIPDYGRFKITIPGRLWSRQPTIDIVYEDGEAYISYTLPPSN